MTGASLTLEEVTVLRDGHALFQPLSLTIAPGEAVSVMGPSGSGKSSLLNHICGALPKGLEGRGRVLLDGQDLKGLPLERRRIGILFQDDLLFPHLSVAENLAFGLSPAYRSRAERAARIQSALTEAEMAGLGERDPATLSGGQRARIALMRTLLADPKALLLDEPFGKLDQGLRARIRDFTFIHARQANLPSLLVTHDPEDAAAAGEKTIVLAPAV